MDELIKLIKKKMIDKGRKDFCKYLGEILGISQQGASKRLIGKTKITCQDLKKIVAELEMEADELKGALLK